MPSNEQRRQAAKRKLERQLERRAEQARKRKQMTIGASVFGAVLVVAAGAVVYNLTKGDDSADTSTTAASSAPQEAGVMPAGRAEALPATVDCTYMPDGQAPAKPANMPNATAVSAEGTVTVNLDTTQGPIGLDLNRAESPCTVNSLVSLAEQGYFNDTPCHRLSTTGLKILQCGDPSGQGTGGPGYGFVNEFPTDQYSPDDPNLGESVTYGRGTIAMANTGQPGSNGSQFFLVYDDSPLPPMYTVFGTISDEGLATIEKVAAAGDDGSMSAGGGKPNTPIQITTASVAA
ncbi:peptidylprolyl isomerase [Rhodococcus tukisamuensis]|uniref:Peptidyl-prolyl cis-trans isomerase B (Cyclophilin B) n=1 Tax=Rhodococcus tukisamuensis TaxID=168276 RepID=A0A1G6QQN3_9NOCA|nr:peptidylprolyl isomerase [Rhodococcus tukisamuensis]SDC94056.1 peptidyl-prolyl cis-trans isomerase B (cyclophilin B) [Rhodococcus tukisamuensis]